jgi:CheY-like chemotaxis protein
MPHIHPATNAQKEKSVYRFCWAIATISLRLIRAQWVFLTSLVHRPLAQRRLRTFACFNLCVVNLSRPQLLEPNQSELLTIPECRNGAAIPGSRALEDLIVILVVEDDQMVQSLVEDALTEGGFEPAIAASGEEAVTLLRGNKSKYRALVTDINLRGRMGGWEVAKHAREIDPEFPIVYMTGASADEWGSQGVPNSILLTKPFAPAQLVTAVSQLLNSGTPTT